LASIVGFSHFFEVGGLTMIQERPVWLLAKKENTSFWGIFKNKNLAFNYLF
jgi:hypothetical protein